VQGLALGSVSHFPPTASGKSRRFQTSRNKTAVNVCPLALPEIQKTEAWTFGEILVRLKGMRYPNRSVPQLQLTATPPCYRSLVRRRRSIVSCRSRDNPRTSAHCQSGQGAGPGSQRGCPSSAHCVAAQPSVTTKTLLPRPMPSLPLHFPDGPAEWGQEERTTSGCAGMAKGWVGSCSYYPQLKPSTLGMQSPFRLSLDLSQCPVE